MKILNKIFSSIYMFLLLLSLFKNFCCIYHRLLSMLQTIVLSIKSHLSRLSILPLFASRPLSEFNCIINFRVPGSLCSFPARKELCGYFLVVYKVAISPPPPSFCHLSIKSLKWPIHSFLPSGALHFLVAGFSQSGSKMVAQK